MSKKYFTLFWIPVRIPPFKNELVKSFSEVYVEDPGFFSNSPNKNTLLTINKIDNNTFGVYISGNDKLPYCNNLNILLLTLKKVAHTKEGFVECEIRPENLNFKFKSVWYSISVHVYRLFKDLYHKHIFHKKTEYFINCERIGFVDDKIINNNKNNYQADFQKFYLTYIKDKLKEYRDFLLIHVSKKYTLGYQYKLFEVFEFSNNLKIIRDYTDKATAVSKYLYILHKLNSKHVDKLKLFSQNIEKLKNQLCEISNARRSSFSVFLGLIGFFLGSVSILISIYWSWESSYNQEEYRKLENREEIRNTKIVLEKIEDVTLLIGKLNSVEDSIHQKVLDVDSLSNVILYQVDNELENIKGLLKPQ